MDWFASLGGSFKECNLASGQASFVGVLFIWSISPVSAETVVWQMPVQGNSERV